MKQPQISNVTNTTASLEEIMKSDFSIVPDQKKLENYIEYENKEWLNKYKGETKEWNKEDEKSRLLFLWYLINHSIYEARKLFENLATKIQLHYDWQILFKSEVEKNLDFILNAQLEIDAYPTLELSGYLNRSIFIEVKQFTRHLISFRELCDELYSENSFSSFCSNNLGDFHMELTELTVDQNTLPIENSSAKKKRFSSIMKNILFDTEAIYNKKIAREKEMFLRLQSRGINVDNYLKDIEDASHSLENIHYCFSNKIEEYIPGYMALTEYYSKFYYTYFLKTKIRDQKLNMYEIETPSILEFNIPIFENYPSFGEKEILSYRWKANKQGDMKQIFGRLKSKILNPNYDTFKKIFSGTETLDIIPLRIKFSSAELIFFIQMLMDLLLIEKESNLSRQRMEKCFVQEDGKKFDIKSFTSLKSQILKSDINDGTYATLSQIKRKEILNIICP